MRRHELLNPNGKQVFYHKFGSRSADGDDGFFKNVLELDNEEAHD